MKRLHSYSPRARRALLCCSAVMGATWLLASCAATYAGDTEKTPLKTSVEPNEKLAALDELYSGLYPWLARLYDAKTGGFYPNEQLRKQPGQAPDIQSTSFALTFLRDDGLIETMPPAVRAKFVAFFQGRQDPQTGFFSDPEFTLVRNPDKYRGRMLRFAMQGLEILGAKPLYPSPGARAPMAETAHLQSADAWRAWLQELPWEKSWGALDELYQQTALLKSLPDARQRELVQIAYEFVKNKQDAETGMAGGGDLGNRVSGAAKFGWFCDEFDLPIPRADALQETTLQWLAAPEPIKAVTLIRNPIEHLADVQTFLTKPLAPGGKTRVLTVSIDALRRFRQKDGGFAFSAQRYDLAPHNFVDLGRAKSPQSDINGTAMAQKTRASLYRLSGVKAPAIAGADGFWKLLKKERAKRRVKCFEVNPP